MTKGKGLPRNSRQPDRQVAIDLGLRGGTDCIPAGGTISEKGYGRAQWEGRDTKAHIVVWRLAGRAIPEGMTLDHICHNPEICSGGVTCPHRACVNIDHLRLATTKDQYENSVNAYRDFCPNGHPWPESRSGTKGCRECRKEYNRRPEVKARSAERKRQRLARKRETIQPKVPRAQGEKNGSAVLTATIVLEARTRYAAGERLSDLARDLGVNYSTLWGAVQGNNWKHL